MLDSYTPRIDLYVAYRKIIRVTIIDCDVHSDVHFFYTPRIDLYVAYRFDFSAKLMDLICTTLLYATYRAIRGV